METNDLLWANLKYFELKKKQNAEFGFINAENVWIS